jgi:twitching motility protein PilT
VAAEGSGAAASVRTAPGTIDPLKLLGQVLMLAVRHRASDVHLRARNHPILRIDGALRSVREIPAFAPDMLDKIARNMMSARHISEFERQHQVDLSFGFKDIGRVRANIFQQRGSVGMVLRVISTEIPRPAELMLPEIVINFTKQERGLVLVTGATGSGKSTTLASLTNEINLVQTRHIITIEDPIEFLFTERRSIITQREIGMDTNTFADAMRAAMREDPDVILLGEMRSPGIVDLARAGGGGGGPAHYHGLSPRGTGQHSRKIGAKPPCRRSTTTASA